MVQSCHLISNPQTPVLTTRHNHFVIQRNLKISNGVVVSFININEFDSPCFGFGLQDKSPFPHRHVLMCCDELVLALPKEVAGEDGWRQLQPFFVSGKHWHVILAVRWILFVPIVYIEHVNSRVETGRQKQSFLLVKVDAPHSALVRIVHYLF